MQYIKYLKKYNKFALATLFSSFLTINLVGYLGAYTLTNYRQASNFSLGSPRPENNKTPTDFSLNYTRDRQELNQQEWIEMWSSASSHPQFRRSCALFS